MKTLFFTFSLMLVSSSGYCQDTETALKRSIVSTDIGFLGIWINYEKHLKDLFTLKTEAGLEGGFGISSSLDVDNYFIFVPTIRVEPRYYYNFNRRVKLEKKTSFNAANYIAVSATYVSNLFYISNVSYFIVQPGLLLIPKLGMQRTIGRRGSFQIAIGAGPFFSSLKTEIVAGIDLRLGFHFK